jgi:hypothetical protein
MMAAIMVKQFWSEHRVINKAWMAACGLEEVGK